MFLLQQQVSLRHYLKSGAALIRVEASNNFDMKLKRRHLITGVVVGLSCFFFHTPALPPK